MINGPPHIDKWLLDVRLHISKEVPEILPILDVYIGEAKFGRQYINHNLNELNSGACILEVGAGSLLLSCQLVIEGFNVTSLEPIGSGFSHFDRMQELIIEQAKLQNCMPKLVKHVVEELLTEDYFDYAFSINVMEHVDDVSLALSRVGDSLKNNAKYRFTCPNYLFPYEPHFNFVTLFSKPLTEKLYKKKIFDNKKIYDPKGTWESLNWINLLQIKRKINSIPKLQVSFNRKFLISTFERVLFDKDFAARRSKWMCLIIKLFVKMRLHYFIWFIPLVIQPTIDCEITRFD